MRYSPTSTGSTDVLLITLNMGTLRCCSAYTPLTTYAIQKSIIGVAFLLCSAVV